MNPTCKHTKVRIVSRHEDTEFLECLDCGYVFDADELRDMEIEDSVEDEAESDPRLEDA
jgi:Zn ribbon nucleic-acid-binding protein